VNSIKKGFGEYNIKLGKQEHFALRMLMAKYDMSSSQIITLALDVFYRMKLNSREIMALDTDMECNQIIGETINANRGVWGYDPEVNDIPCDKKHLLISTEHNYEFLE
jgi:hypothetical protein